MFGVYYINDSVRKKLFILAAGGVGVAVLLHGDYEGAGF